MNKRIAMLLCTAVLALGLAVVPALALADPLTPVEVETYTYGPFDEPRVNKVYQLSVTDGPSGIPTEDFEQGGRRYYLLDMTVANADHETVIYITDPVAERVAQQFEICRLCDKDRKNSVGNRFVAELVAQLLQEGRLVTAETTHGEGIRTATAKELGARRQSMEQEPVEGQITMTL